MHSLDSPARHLRAPLFLLANLLVGSLLVAQAPGEVIRAIKIPGGRPGDPVLRSGDGFGRDVANAGDVDGDGTTDLLVGAGNNSDGLTSNETRTNAGAAWLMFMNPDGTPRESVRYSNLTAGMPELEQGDFFGKAVAGIGDVDGDGVIDLAIGAPGDDDYRLDHGALYILFIHADGSIKSYQKISALEGGFTNLGYRSEFGRAVEPLGDFNGDGVLDVVATRMPRGSIKGWSGAAYLLFLNSDGTVKNYRRVQLSDIGLDYVRDNRFGFSLSTRDMNGDGILDLISGDLTYDGYPIDGAVNPHNGAVWVVTLDALGLAQDGWLITEGVNGFTEDLDPADHFGSGIDAPEVDFDGDGVFDLVVGRKRDDDSLSGACGGITFCPDWGTCCHDSGAAYILFMNPDGTVKGYQKISNLHGNFPYQNNQDDRFGQSVDTLGDLDGDGFPEVVIAARWDDEPAPNSGIVYVCTINDGSVTQTNAWFSAAPTSGTAPLTVQFTDESTGDTLSSWLWYFGDGTTSTEQHPAHTYTVPGTYDVRLEVDGLSGQDHVVRPDLVAVVSDELVVEFSAQPTAGTAPLTVQFTDLTIGDPVSWEWDFGDGATSTMRNPTHVYTELGSFDVSLTVTASDAETATLVKPAYVSVGEDFRRIGCDPQVMGTFNVYSGEPAIGTDIVFSADNPFGTQAAGSIVYLRFNFAPDANYPCGTMRANLGMAFPGAPGEVLVAVPARSRTGTAYGGPGNPGLVTLTIPDNIGLIGTGIYAQGLIVDSNSTYGIRGAVTDGLEFYLRQ